MCREELRERAEELGYVECREGLWWNQQVGVTLTTTEIESIVLGSGKEVFI